MKRTVLTDGTFHMFCKPPQKLLLHISELGDKLIVDVSSDDFNQLKKHLTSSNITHT